MAEFDESKINRDDEGKFAPKGTIAEKERFDEITSSITEIAIDEKLGIEFKGVKGVEAIEKLLIEKQGHVKAAFTHEEIGDIDIIWGDEKSGLLHIIKRRDEDFVKGLSKISGVDMVRRIPQIIDKGTFKYNKQRKAFEIEYGNERVVVMPQMYGNSDIKWVLTAYVLN